MKSYTEWQNEQPQQAVAQQSTKKWKATKQEVMQFWQKLQPNMPLAMQPIPYEHEGSTYQQDGIRVTGSKEFIISTIARLKEFIQYERPQTKLQVVFRQTDKTGTAAENKVTYVFYIQAKDRGPTQQKTGIKPPVVPKPSIKSPSPAVSSV